MVHLYDTQTQRIIWSGEQYLVDGRPGVVVPPLVLLTEVVIPRPEPESGQTVAPVTVIDVQAGTLTRGWSEPREKTADERRYQIAPLTLVDRLTPSELKVVIGLALGSLPESITDQQEGAWRLMLSLGATGHLFSDGRASLVLPALFGAPRAAELLAPDPTYQPS